MPIHRFRRFANRSPISTGTTPAVEPRQNFVMCPACLFQGISFAHFQLMQAIYREAFRLACEAIRPYWLRDDHFWAFN